ncbi:MAG: hypothetical protein WDZ42_00215 [Candidatus Saccharimonadales bacterium]
MKLVFPLYKRRGETPLETLERFRANNSEYEGVPLSYAGRLDPAASGVILVLAGEKCKEKEKYIKLPKEYRAEILLGIQTDTYDLLGVAQKTHPPEMFDSDLYVDITERFKGSHMWPYPPYSSKTVNGKPLWKWAREGRLDEIEIPRREMTFRDISLRRVDMQESHRIQQHVQELLSEVSGDFRQEEIWRSWRDIPKRAFPVISLDVECEGGAYIRSLAHYIGEEFGTGAVLYDLERTRVGNIGLWRGLN